MVLLRDLVNNLTFEAELDLNPVTLKALNDDLPAVAVLLEATGQGDPNKFAFNLTASVEDPDLGGVDIELDGGFDIPDDHCGCAQDHHTGTPCATVGKRSDETRRPTDDQLQDGLAAAPMAAQGRALNHQVPAVRRRWPVRPTICRPVSI